MRVWNRIGHERDERGPSLGMQSQCDECLIYVSCKVSRDAQKDRVRTEGSNSSIGRPGSGAWERDAGGIAISRRARALPKKTDEENRFQIE
jgi:hypothetical protein